MQPKQSSLAVFFLPVNYFAVIYSLVILCVAVLGLAVIYFERHLPKKLVYAYKYGKTLPKNERTLVYLGETFRECLQDLIRFQVRQVPKRFVC